MSDETRERPGPIGRAVRSVAGVAMALVCLRVLTSYAALVDARGPADVGLWAGLGASLWILPDVLSRGLGLAWGRWGGSGGAGPAATRDATA